MNRTNKPIGIAIIIIGILFLLKNFNLLGPWSDSISFGHLVGTFWPMILIFIGLCFHYGFISGGRRDAGLLVPGGILLVLGIAFQFNMLFGFWDVIWPVYIFSVAFGLFELYAFGGREKGLLIPIGILGGLSVIFFFTISFHNLFGPWAGRFITPLVLILIGAVVIFGKKPVH
jgi:hypothetical protein